MVLVIGSGLLCTGVLAAIDLASEVGVRVVARPASASGPGEDFELRNGGVLRSGDGVQLRLETDADAYVYVIAYGSSQTAMLLHPFSGRAQDARVRPGHVEIIPGADVFLPLDEREGRETLFTVVSEAPLPDIADLLPRIEAHGNDLSAITALIDSAYPSVRRLTFKHIGAKPLVGVSATAARAPSAPSAGEPAAGDPGAEQTAGASLLPPADGGWSVSSTQGFGTSAAAAAPAVDAAPASSTAAVAAETPSVLLPRSSDSATANGESAPASDALREAREAAGIDESEFRGILSTLPDSAQAGVPESLRKSYKEEGVLSAEGTRMRSMGKFQTGAGTDGRSQN